MKKLVGTALVVIGMLLALPMASASALASPGPSGLQIYSRYFYSTTFPGGIVGTLACPSGSRLVSSGSGAAQILAATPVQNFTAVTIVAGAAYPAPDNFALVSITCAPADQFADVRTVKTVEPGIRPGVFSRGISRCPSGMYAFGGGGYFSSSSSTDVQGSAYNNVSNTPSADGTAWTFSGVAPPASSTLVTVTQCAPKVGRDLIVQAGVLSQVHNAISNVYADCPAGYTAVSGGFYISNPDGSEATPGNALWSVPAARSASITSWYASGYTRINTKMVALAQCIR